MDKIINIAVRNRIAVADPGQCIVCGNKDYTVAFDFDDEWVDSDVKTARFFYRDVFIDRVFTGNTVDAPELANISLVKIGVFTEDITTTPAIVRCYRSILCDGGNVQPPEDDVYDRIIKLINDLQMNGVTDEQIAEAVEKYLTENPIEGGGGEAGGYYIPSVDTSGNLTWLASDSGMPTVASANIKGPKGDTGPQGPAGADGEKGEPGAKGDKGDTGAQGVQGEPGAKGDKGESGSNGTSVTHSWNGSVLTLTSASGTSSVDLKGDKGDTGAQGPQGDKGDTGATGPQGEQGPQGPKGDTGATGPAGKDGQPGKDGSAGAPGADGISPTVSVSKSGKVTTISVTDKNGTKTATINDGADGNDGKTPVRGVDYYTAADQEAIVQQVITALGTPVFGRVDAENNIILTGELVEGTYTIKYEDTDGEQTTIGTLTTTAAPTYTNLFDPATATLNTRMSGSSNTSKSENGYVMTAVINLPVAISITSSSDEHFIAVPAGMWANSANIFFGNTNGNAQGYNDVSGSGGIVAGNWTKIPLSNKRGTSISCDRIIVSLYVKGSAITASDIQDIGIYFDEIPE